MCGIAGIIFADPQREVPARVIGPALDAIVHRGPDGEGRIVAPGIAAGMRRLAIIDVRGGDQPIYNEDKTVGVLFNGEIYNFAALREECIAAGHTFQTHSDTEVLVHLYEKDGDQFLARLDGMFAFVIWDARHRRALIARDRFGIKPLYVARTRHGLAFASEIKSIAALGLTEPACGEESIAHYFRHLWVPEPDTCWKGVTSLPPGTSVVVERGLASAPRRFHLPTLRPRIDVDAREAVDRVRALVASTTQQQLVADVPVGAFLSGGLDSSLLVSAAATGGRSVPVHTMRTLAADAALDPQDDDATHAAAVASALGLPHHIYDLTPNLVDLLPRLVEFCDDPIADPAIINTYLICAAARGTSRVLLSGMGADELNGGYRRHQAGHALRPYFAMPRAVRRAIATPTRWTGRQLAARAPASIPTARRLAKAAIDVPIGCNEIAVGYASWTRNPWLETLGLVPPPRTILATRSFERIDTDPVDPLAAVMAFDMGMYLPSHNLHYVDAMSMAASVEVRVPYLGNELAETLLTLPNRLRVDWRGGKVALRRAADGLVPKHVLDRPKAGFGAPIRSWLAGPLRPMIRDLLLPAPGLQRLGVRQAGIEQAIHAHETTDEDLSYLIWALMTLELWSTAVHRRARAEPMLD